MAFVHGKDSYCALDDSSGTERNLSSFIDNVTDAMGRALSDVTAFGDEGVKNIPGLQNSTFSITGHWDPTATTGPHAVLSGLVSASDTATVSFGPAGNTAGLPSVTAECWVTNYSITSAVAEKISFSVDLQVDGTVTFGTFS